MFSLESPHRCDSNEYTQYTIFNIQKKFTLNFPKSAAMGFFSKGLKNEFETAVVNDLVGCFGFYGPLRQYFSLHRTVSQGKRKKRENIDEREKNVLTPPSASTARAKGPCPTIVQISRSPRY